MIDERAVRAGLQKLVGDIAEDVWDYLVDEDRAVEAVIKDDYDLNWLARKYRRLLAIGGRAGPTPKPAPKMLAPTEPSPSETPERRSTTELRLATLSRLVA